MKNKEKLFRQHKGPWQERNELRKSFLNVRKTFDRCLARKEKQFNRSKVLIIDSYSKNNHKLFWDQIHKLGPNSKKMQKVLNVVRINAHLTSDKDQVKQKWFSDFAMLYTGPSVGLNQCSVDNIFYEDILHRIRAREYFMECDGYVENEFLNVDISFDEILKIVKALKLKKSVGYDKVPNECLNYYNITLFMYHFFKLCFDNSVVPVEWTKAIIAPVPKQGKDPYEPLSYRGISLLSCIGKVYSALIESRIVKYCDMLGLIADEQNGFRRGRSCSEHIFLVTSIIRSRV